MAEKTKLEVEGGELLIKSSKGIMAVIPKSHTPHVRKLIEEKNFAAVDKFVQSLQPLKRNPNAGKAQDGVVIDNQPKAGYNMRLAELNADIKKKQNEK